jgi:hypothetical protein
MTTQWIYQGMSPTLKAELLAGRHAEYPRLRQIFIDGFAREAEEWAERVSLGQTTLPSHLWGMA